MSDPLACADLAAAVIQQAFADACRPDREKGTRRNGTATPHERSQAWYFLTATSGEWARARADWCWLCGVDPDVIRQEALNRGPKRGVVPDRADGAKAP